MWFIVNSLMHTRTNARTYTTISRRRAKLGIAHLIQFNFFVVGVFVARSFVRFVVVILFYLTFTSQMANTLFRFYKHTHTHTYISYPSWIINVSHSLQFGIDHVDQQQILFRIRRVCFSAEWIYLWFNLKWKQELNNDNSIYLFMGESSSHGDRMGIRVGDV